MVELDPAVLTNRDRCGFGAGPYPELGSLQIRCLVSRWTDKRNVLPNLPPAQTAEDPGKAHSRPCRCLR